MLVFCYFPKNEAKKWAIYTGERAFFEKTVFGERVAGDSFFGMKIKNGWFVRGRGPVGGAHGGVGRGGLFVVIV